MAMYGNRWTVERSLGEGGQAHVFVVSDETGAYESAVLKRLKNKESPQRLARFKSEAAALRDISNPHVLRLVDMDVDGPAPYIVTEYCVGGTLAQADIDSFSTADRVRLLSDVLEGVASAHERGIVHRDLKPENIFLRSTRGPAVVGDFGLSYFESGERHTLLDEAVGLWLFIAPELEDGRVADVKPTADVYALGRLIYWVMSGKQVFSREKHRTTEYNLGRAMLDERYELFNGVLDQAITADPGSRLGSAAELRAEFERAARLFLDGYRAVTSFPQRCTYCGDGLYRRIAANSPDELRNNLGMAMPAGPKWRVFACGNCGHMLWFRPDMGKNRNWLDGPFVDPGIQ